MLLFTSCLHTKLYQVC